MNLGVTISINILHEHTSKEMEQGNIIISVCMCRIKGICCVDFKQVKKMTRDLVYQQKYYSQRWADVGLYELRYIKQ